MKLYRVELMWWGRISVTRHYTARSAREAYRFASADHHTVIKIWRARTDQLVYPA